MLKTLTLLPFRYLSWNYTVWKQSKAILRAHNEENNTKSVLFFKDELNVNDSIYKSAINYNLQYKKLIVSSFLFVLFWFFVRWFWFFFSVIWQVN